MKTLVTGAAGFIGFHTARKLIARGDDVVRFDVVNDYYDPALKEARLVLLDEAGGAGPGNFAFIRADLADQAGVNAAFAVHRFDRVIHLAAQAGVRQKPDAPTRLRPVEHRRLHQRSRGLPAQRDTASHLCLDLERLWCQYHTAVSTGTSCFGTQ